MPDDGDEARQTELTAIGSAQDEGDDSGHDDGASNGEDEPDDRLPAWLEDAVPRYFEDPQPRTYADFPAVRKVRPGALAMAILRQNLHCNLIAGTAHLALTVLGIPGVVGTGATAAVLALVLALGGPCAVWGAVGGSTRNLSQRWVTLAAMVAGGALTAVGAFSAVSALGWVAVCANVVLAARAAAAQWWARGVADMPANYREFLLYVGLLRDGVCAAGPAPDDAAFDREIARRRQERRERRVERAAAKVEEEKEEEEERAKGDDGVLATTEDYTNTLSPAPGPDATV